MSSTKDTRLYFREGETHKCYAHRAVKDGHLGICYKNGSDEVIGYTLIDDLYEDLKKGDLVDLDGLDF